MSVARTKGSSFLADEIIIHRRDQDYLKKRINDEYKIPMVLNAMNDEIKKLINRVLNVIDSFTGYTHVMVIGGGAELISDAVQKHTNIRKDRFLKLKHLSLIWLTACTS